MPPMSVNPQKQAAKKVIEYWTFHRPGREKSGCQQYWNMPLRELLGQTELECVIRCKVPVQAGGTASVPSADATTSSATRRSWGPR